MKDISATRPASKPVRAKTARAVRKPAVKPPGRAVTSKAAPEKIAKDSKAPAKDILDADKVKRTAATVARSATVAKTMKLVGDTAVVIDANDSAAWEHVAASKIDAVETPADVPETGPALIERVARSVERELAQIDAILAGDHNKPRRYTEAERRARTLASLARTLSEIGRLRAADEGHAYVPSAARDLDGFRKTLWKRLEQSLTRRPDVGSGGDDAAGDA